MENSRFTAPIEYAVYQRSVDNNARVKLSGVGLIGAQTIKLSVYLVGSTAEYKTVSVPVESDGTFSTYVDLQGGWYFVQGRTSLGDFINVARFGVGEVFCLFGHSFMQGGFDLTNQKPATDERVCTLLDVEFDQQNRFGPLKDVVGPFNSVPECWGQLGDKLVQTLGVPVLFYGAAFGGSNLDQSVHVIQGIPFEHGFVKYDKRMPIIRPETVMDRYVPITGIRALLVEHGYNDNAMNRATVAANYRIVLDYLRQRAKAPNMAAILVQEELTEIPGRLAFVATAEAIRDVLADPNNFKGPDFNGPAWTPANMRGADKHLAGPGIDLFGQEWYTSIMAALPKMAAYPVTITAANTATVDDTINFNVPTVSNEVWAWLLFGLAVVVGLSRKRNG